MINIKCLKDYADYMGVDIDDEEAVNALQSNYDDWRYEALRVAYYPNETTVWVENTEREGLVDDGNGYFSCPAMLKKTVSGIWKWQDTIETGGYWELYDIERDFHRFFSRCSCNDAQMVWYRTDGQCGFCFNGGV